MSSVVIFSMVTIYQLDPEQQNEHTFVFCLAIVFSYLCFRLLTGELCKQNALN